MPVYQRGKRWRAYVYIDRKVVHLGTFATQEEALAVTDANQPMRRRGRKGMTLPLRAERHIFRCIMDRCNNPNAKGYDIYGGRGIKCEFETFEDFIMEIGPRPGPQWSVNRLDNNGHYTYGNVEWATRIEQANNRSNSRFITHAGRSQTIAQWSRETGIPYQTIYGRLSAGWEASKALQKLPDLH